MEKHLSNEGYPPHLKAKTPIINLPLYHTDPSLFTFFSIEETSSPRKTASCNFCGKQINFIPGSYVHSSYTLSLKRHLQSHPSQFDLYLELLARNMQPDTRTKYQHFCRMEYPTILPKADREKSWEEYQYHKTFVPKDLAGEPYEKNDYYSKQNFKGGFLPDTVDAHNVKMLETIYRFTNRNVPLYELVGTWNVNNYLDRKYLRYKAILQNTGNMVLDLERLLFENTFFFDPEKYDSCPNNHTGDIAIFGDSNFQQKIENLDNELEKYPEFLNDKSFNSQMLKEVGCVQKDSTALLEMNRLLKIILSMITVKKDFLGKKLENIIEKNTSDDKLVKPHFAIQLWGPKFVDFDDQKNRNTQDFSESLYHTYQHVDDRDCPAYNDDTKVVLKEPSTDEHGNAIYPCNIGGCRKPCDCQICNFSGDEITRCQKHSPDHPDLFDDEEDIVIMKRVFFHENKKIEFERPYPNTYWRPKDLKLAGMKKNCDVCLKIVLDHSRNHHCFKIHSELCQICGHIELISEKSMTLTCPFCKKKFESKYRLQDHIDAYSEENKYSCEECSRKFPTNFTKQRHITEVHGEQKTKYLCDLSDSQFSSERNLKKHKDNCHNDSTVEYSCDLCDSKFKRNDNLNQHLKEVHDIDRSKQIFRGINDQGEYFPCLECDSVFKRKYRLDRHVTAVHGVSTRFECNQCGETFSRRENLKRHLESVHVEKDPQLSPTFSCNICNETFNRKDNLKKHINIFHTKSDSFS